MVTRAPHPQQQEGPMRRKIQRHLEHAQADIGAALDALGKPDSPVEPERPEKPEPPPDSEEVVAQLDGLPPVSLTPEQPWATVGGWLHVRAWWEPHGITVLAANAYPDQGPRAIGNLIIWHGDWHILEVEHKPLPPRYAYIASTIPDEGNAWSDSKDDRWYPEWSEERVDGEIASHAGLVLDHPVWWHDRHHGAVAGHGVAPFEGGRDDWLCGPNGKRLRWRQVLGEAWTNFWALDPETGEPLIRPVPWWTGNSAQAQLPGFVWEPKLAEEHTLWNRGRCHDGYHYRRVFGQVAALAPFSEPCQFILRMLWANMKQEWSMEDGAPTSSNPLLMPLAQRVAASMEGHVFDVNAYSPWGNRGLAHAINTLLEARPYLHQDEVKLYCLGFGSLANNIHDAHGICGRDASGGAAQWANEPYNMEPPFSMTFHEQLVHQAVEALEAALARPGITASRRAFLTERPPPYGFESRATDRRETVWDRKSTISGGNAEYAYAGYTVFTHNVWPDAPNWRSFEEMDAAAQKESLTGLPRYGCVPPEMRGA